MSSKESLKRYHVAAIPIIRWVVGKLDLRSILLRYIPPHGNETVPAVDSLILLLCNLMLGRQPLYELDTWVQSIDYTYFYPQEIPPELFNDDRFGRALDKLYHADRASLSTEIVVNMLKTFDVDLSRVHNDSTTVKAFGKIPGKTRTGLELKKGKSKDHRPDLKQLVYSLTISADGAVPIHQKSYAGNRTDDTTHIETWNTVRDIAGKSDFIYVADCKVCTNKQLTHIVGNGGRVVTIVPETWKETKDFKDKLRKTIITKEKIWKKRLEDYHEKYDYFYNYSGNYWTKQGYKIYWIYSSEKKNRDRVSREEDMQEFEKTLSNLNVRLNTRDLKTKEQILSSIAEIKKACKASSLYNIEIESFIEEHTVQTGKGRPGPKTQYDIVEKISYALCWKRNQQSLKEEKKLDGIFPLLSTDTELTAIEALKAYKYQPRLEKRFDQFKNVHKGAPLLFKKIERVEAMMFLFYLMLMGQALIEREVRKEMLTNGIDSLKIYPEFRDATRPTTTKIMYTFEAVSRYCVSEAGKRAKEFRDELTEVQQTVLHLLGISENKYWHPERFLLN